MLRGETDDDRSKVCLARNPGCHPSLGHLAGGGVRIPSATKNRQPDCCFTPPMAFPSFPRCLQSSCLASDRQCPCDPPDDLNLLYRGLGREQRPGARYFWG